MLRFFVLITGAVSIYASMEHHRKDDSGAAHGLQLWKQSEDAYCLNSSNLLDSNHNTARAPLDRSKFGRFVGTIEPGQGFDEYGLLQAESSRSSSFIADEVSRLMVVDRELYDSCLRPFRGLQLSARQKLAHQYPLFASWPESFIKMAVISLKPKRAGFGMNIVTQGQAVDGLIFLATGEVKILMNPLLHITQYSQLDLESFKRSKEDKRSHCAKEW
ncbi:unnamed protein product [Schistocephalus solidus]|uniref:Cyclic nucleotide-binding domain-containing protein n=1 Tax=Schistocephalus solidus TaxID=70667 RepID=A0A183SKU8_SCHSO|nr:unnamed protein product [Schistocephalus solidus]